jgi:sodium transport system permease protein
VEKHYGSGTGTGKRILNPVTEVYMEEDSSMEMEMVQIKGVDDTERGTVATLLITPMKRSHLAVGKVIGSSVTALLSGLSSFVGVMLSLPKLMGEEIVEGASYGATDYLLILAVMLSAVLLFVSIISVLSALASSVKEASTMLLPVMILVMGVGVSGMFTGSLPTTPALYLIPIYGSVAALSSIFSYAVEPLSILLAVLSSLVSAVGLTVLLARMFASERVMFRR